MILGFLQNFKRFNYGTIGLVVGVLLRLKNYLENRPLNGDECWAAMEVLNRSFGEILRNDYIFPISSRPPMLSVLARKVTVLFLGNNEMTLRLVPFLFGIAGLCLFYFLAKKFLKNRSFVLAIWLFALSEPLVYYSAEAKRYAAAVFSAIFLWNLAFDFFKENIQARKIIILGLWGAVLLWLSYFSFFISCATLLAIGAKVFSERHQKGIFAWLSAISAVIISFSFLYLSVLKEAVHGEEMRNYFQHGFWHGHFDVLALLSWLIKVFVASLVDPGGLGWPGFMAVFLIFGLWSLGKENFWMTVVFGLSIIFPLVAATVGVYPFAGRVIVALTPAYYFFLVSGVDFLVYRFLRNNRWVLILLLFFVFYRPVSESFYYAFHSRVKTDVRQMLLFFNRNYQPGDFICVNEGARYPFFYYSTVLGYGKNLEKKVYFSPEHGSQSLVPLGIIVENQLLTLGVQALPVVSEFLFFDKNGAVQKEFYFKKRPLQVITPRNIHEFLKKGRTWVLLANSDEVDLYKMNKVVVSLFALRGKELLSFEDKGVTAYLFDIF